MNDSVWFKTLDYFLSEGYVNNGLTLPFLVGLYEHNEMTIEDLIEDFSDSKYISIQKCGNIDEFIFGIYIDEGDSELYKKIEGLICLDDSLNHISTLSELIEFFEFTYSEEIENSLFSKNGEDWTDYTEEEKKQLSELNFITKKL